MLVAKNTNSKNNTDADIFGTENIVDTDISLSLTPSSNPSLLGKLSQGDNGGLFGDLRLLHHYHTAAGPAVKNHCGIRRAILDFFPRLALNIPALMHALLALAASHLIEFYESNSMALTQIRTLATVHRQAAIRGLRDHLAHCSSSSSTWNQDAAVAISVVMQYEQYMDDQFEWPVYFHGVAQIHRAFAAQLKSSELRSANVWGSDSTGGEEALQENSVSLRYTLADLHRSQQHPVMRTLLRLSAYNPESSPSGSKNIAVGSWEHLIYIAIEIIKFREWIRGSGAFDELSDEVIEQTIEDRRESLSKLLAQWITYSTPDDLADRMYGQDAMMIAWAVYFALTLLKLKDNYERGRREDRLNQPWVLRPAAKKIFYIAEYLKQRGKLHMFSEDMTWPLQIAAWSESCRQSLPQAFAAGLPPAHFTQDNDKADREFFFPPSVDIELLP